MAVRLLPHERRALVRMARERSVSVSDLVRRLVRTAIADERDGEPLASGAGTSGPHPESVAAMHAAVGRITNDLRRLRELIAAAG